MPLQPHHASVQSTHFLVRPRVESCLLTHSCKSRRALLLLLSCDSCSFRGNCIVLVDSSNVEEEREKWRNAVREVQRQRLRREQSSRDLLRDIISLGRS